MNPDQASVQGLREVVRVLGRLGIAYALGGSMASSIHGTTRFTWDADLTVEPFPGRAAALAEGLGADWYLSLPAVEEALRQRSSFNAINTATGFKADLFVCKDDGFERAALARRLAVPLPGAGDDVVFVQTPEDVVLFKLRWYRLGDEASEQQWRDVLGVLACQKGRLDRAYLDHWAGELGVADLLGRALRESGC